MIPHENSKHTPLESHSLLKKKQTTDNFKDTIYIVRLIANENSGQSKK